MYKYFLLGIKDLVSLSVADYLYSLQLSEIKGRVSDALPRIG